MEATAHSEAVPPGPCSCPQMTLFFRSLSHTTALCEAGRVVGGSFAALVPQQASGGDIFKGLRQKSKVITAVTVTLQESHEPLTDKQSWETRVLPLTALQIAGERGGHTVLTDRTATQDTDHPYLCYCFLYYETVHHHAN